MSRDQESALRFRRRGHYRLALAAFVAASVCLAGTASAEILNAPQLAERLNGSAFVYRGSASVGSGTYYENHIWRFDRDGTFSDIGTAGHILNTGYWSVELPRTVGTWRQNGNQICMQWQSGNARYDGCYDVLTSAGRQVTLVGPQIMTGTLEPADSAHGASTAGVGLSDHR